MEKSKQSEMIDCWKLRNIEQAVYFLYDIKNDRSTIVASNQKHFSPEYFLVIFRNISLNKVFPNLN